jgi:hypothetical protein
MWETIAIVAIDLALLALVAALSARLLRRLDRALEEAGRRLCSLEGPGGDRGGGWAG